MAKKTPKPKATMKAPPAKPPVVIEQLSAAAQRAAASRERAQRAARAFDVSALAFLDRRAGRSPTPLEEGAGHDPADGHRRSLRMGQRGPLARRCSVDPECHRPATPGRPGCDRHPAAESPEYLPPPPQSDPGGELAAALADGAPTEPDPVPAEVARCLAELEEGTRLLVRAERRLERLRRNPKAGRETTSEPCRLCGSTPSGLGEDRLRSGYCPKDYQAWVRAGRPDRLGFERARQAELEEQAEVAS